MNHDYITNHLGFAASPIAEQNAVIVHGNYRITVLASRLFRIELDPSRTFEDRATQTVWHRDISAPFDQVLDGDVLIVSTDHCVVRLDPTKRPEKGITVAQTESGRRWHFGDTPKHNLKGTYRTLDQADGPVELENGLISKDGVACFDDSGSLCFEDGVITSKNNNDLDLYIFAYGQDYGEAICDYYRIAGVTPLLPKYTFGNWWSRYWNYNDAELRDVIAQFEQRRIPLSVCIIDMDWHITDVPAELGGGWTGYTWNKDYFPNPEETMHWLKEQGLKVSLNLHPADGIRPFDDCYEAVCKTMGIDPKQQQIIPFDLTNDAFVKAYFEDIHHPLEQQGVDFWWIDWQQGTKSKMDGLDPLFQLNHYHYLDGVNRGKTHNMIFSRWPGLGGHRYPIGFSGDTQITWDSLKFQPYFTNTATNVGFGWWSHDIGGHFHGRETADLYTRWVQLGVFSPVLRLHSTKSFYHRREPWRWDKEVEFIATEYLRLRHRLIPYIHTFNHRQADGDLPMILPLYYIYPDHGASYEFKNQYFFGSELMVLPFTSPRHKTLGLAKETMYFFEDGWIDFFTGAVIERSGEQVRYGSLRDINVFAKPGAIVPLATNHEDGLEDLPPELDIHCFPGADGVFDLIEDQGGVRITTTIHSDYNDGIWTIAIESDADTSHERILHFYLRSIHEDIRIDGHPESILIRDAATNTSVLEVIWDMTSPIEFTIAGNAPLRKNPFNFEATVMHALEQSNYSTSTKNKVGYINYNNPHESRGWLEADLSPHEKRGQLKNLDLPKSLQRYLKDLIDNMKK